MKKLVFVMLAVLAMSFVSCGNFASESKPEQKDSIVYTVDPVSGDTIKIDTVKVDLTENKETTEVQNENEVAPKEETEIQK